jgi:hypothetical protein
MTKSPVQQYRKNKPFALAGEIGELKLTPGCEFI